MTDTSIAATVRQFIVDKYLPGEDPSRLVGTTPLISAGILDSLSVLELVSFLESRYHIEFKAHEVDREHLDTLDGIERLVRAKLGRDQG